MCPIGMTEEIMLGAELDGDLKTFAVSDLRFPLVIFCSLRAFLQASETHGNGLFVLKDSASGKGFIPLPLVGRFEMHDDEDGCWQLLKQDGVPRLLVLPNVTLLLSGSEVARPTSVLCPVPDKTCPLFNMNSSAAGVER